MIFKIPSTLASRLTLWYAAIFVVFSASAFLGSYFLTDIALNKRFNEDLLEDILEFRMLMQADGIEGVKREISREAASEGPEIIFLRIADANGETVFTTDPSRWKGFELSQSAFQQIAAGGGPVLGAATIKDDDDDKDAKIITGLIGDGVILQAGESMEEKEEFMELLFTIFAATFVVLIGPAALVGWFMARKSLRGVEEVSEAALDVANGSLDRQVSVKDRGDEIERLAATFNVMVERLRKLIFGMREMTDSIAHDLRSPLARIRANAETALSSANTLEDHQASQADTLEECDRLLQLINATLDVAEAEAGAAQLSKEDVDLSIVIQDACELFEPIAEDQEIELSTELIPSCHVNGNKQYLQRMLANLLDNALKYTRRKGSIKVSLATDSKTASIYVHDSGIGIAPADQERIFERFFRCDQSRTKDGCGMGLSFARAVANAHGGDITLSSEPGKGSIFSVTLPV